MNTFMEFTKEELINHYNDVCAELEAFEDTNGAVLTQYETLKQAKTDYLNEIKEKARIDKEEITLSDSLVTVTPAYRKWIDYDKAKERMSEAQVVFLDSITSVKKEVDMEKFVSACRDGILPIEIRLYAYQEQELTPRVSVKSLTE